MTRFYVLALGKQKVRSKTETHTEKYHTKLSNSL